MFFYICMSLSIILIPGPDMIFVLTQSISSGIKAGIRTILGSLTGTFIHTLLAAFGLSIIVQKSPFVFEVIKYGGAVYLLFLAIQSFREKSESTQLDPDGTQLKGFFRKGFITNIANPKMPIFFLTFLPQFVHVGTGDESFQIFFLGIIFIIETFIVFFIVSLFSSRLRDKLSGNALVSNIINYFKGTIFAGLGIKLLLLSR
ncbi:LysE family translocator [Robertmurraya korlensis]|uniref:LysE family translocator n=1 Tax=Robertmurraya korlensis TaxID=519977 RepID=UPI00203AB279|nr:LysE family translocator [Robertmurraya korlensis]MCM3600863.1 LysE family translocator [Robertmurraya korlensis]